VDPITITIGILVVLAMAYVVYLIAQASARSWENVSIERINAFSVEPNFICNSGACLVDIAYNIDTNQANSQATLTMIGPKGTQRVLATTLTFSLSTNGADPTFWSDGPGAYTFELHLTGNLVGSTSELRGATLFQNGGEITHDARVDMAQMDDLQNARDSFRVAELHRFKGTEHTICSKSALITGVRYVNGGIFGHPRALDVTLRNDQGVIIRDFLGMQPGDQVTINPPLDIANGIQIDGLMVGGSTGAPPLSQPNPFSPSDIVPWELEIFVGCRH
jgi:hypothetical protein